MKHGLKMINPVAQIRIRRIKNLLLMFFATGFFCFLLFGIRYIDDVNLFNRASLIQVRDSVMNQESLLKYILIRHIILLVAFSVLWWLQWGRKSLYLWLGISGMKLGIAFSIALVRYRLKGVLLWALLYLPHSIFYFGACICGFKLCQSVMKKRDEKLSFLLRNLGWILGVLLVWALGIYMECYVSSGMIQSYLQHF